MVVSHVEEESLEKNCWKLYFDGASNAMAHGIGAVLITPKGEYYPFMARLDFNCTNNVAKYEACAMSLQAAIDKWVRDSCLLLYHKHITEMIKQFNEINFNYLPWEENQMVNALATLAAMF